MPGDMPDHVRRFFSRVLLAVAVLLLVLSTGGGTEPSDAVSERPARVLEHQAIALGGEYRGLKVVEKVDGRIIVERDAKGVIASVALPAGVVRLCLWKDEPARAVAKAELASLPRDLEEQALGSCTGGEARSYDAVPISRSALAAIGVVLVIFFLPLAVGARWGDLLKDTTGKPSLGAVQFLIWFVPGAVMLAALTLPQRAFPEMDASLALLVGLSGGTALLANAAKDPAKNANPPTGVKGLVSNVGGQSEVSRHQLLVVSIVGAVTVMAAFWFRLQVPRIPPEVLALIGASQATFVGAKAVDALK